jgi:two-component system chemotaxis response regulator CheY
MTKILVVDDAKIMRDIIKKTLLEYENCEIIEAQNGEEAVDIYKEELPDLVTMDITMELKDGLNAAKQILDYDQYAKIVMVTSLGQEKLLRQCIQIGVLDYIVKPFSKDRILSSVSTALTK